MVVTLARNAPGLGDPRKMTVGDLVQYLRSCRFAMQLERGMTHRERVAYLNHLGL